MCEQYSLPALADPITNRNPKGRPRKIHSTKFSTQPRSIVSQMLEKMITENKIILPIRHDSEENRTNSIIQEDSINLNSPTEDSDQTEEYTISQESKKKYYSKSKEKMEPKIYPCDFLNCLYSTKLPCNLQKHKRTHTGEKPYLCDQCSFRTNFSNSLRVHRRLHTDERPYLCTICDYRCNSISNLKKHCHTKHKDKDIPKANT